MPNIAAISSLTRLNATIKDLLVQLYDLSPLDVELLFLLIKSKKPLTLEQLTQKSDRDKSTAFRSLQKLVGLGICIKETKTQKEGGYYHEYSAVDIETFKAETQKRIEELQKSFDRFMKKFEDDIRKAILTFYEK
jgi:predicted transcriptional regulator